MFNTIARKMAHIRDTGLTASVVVIAIVIISLLISINIYQSQEKYLTNAIKAGSQNLENIILKNSSQTIKSIQRMVERWKMTSGTNESTWRADAKKYINDVIGVDTLMWVNKDGINKWVMSESTHQVIHEGSKFTQDDKLLIRMQNAIINKTPEFSDITALSANRYALYASFPIWVANNFDGYLTARIDINQLFNEMIKNGESKGFILQVNADGKQVYTSPGDYDQSGPKQTFNLSMDNDQDSWLITVYPTKEFLALFKSPLPLIIMFSGSMIALLFYITMISRIRVQKVAKKLENEIDQRKKVESKLDHMAHHNALTQLPNRTYLKIYLESKIIDRHVNKKIIAVMYLNIDDFKLINEIYGREFADKILKVFSSRISEVMKENAMVAHMGEDEFVICLSERLIDQKIFIYAEDLLRNIRKPITIEGTTLRITASVGISYYPEHGSSVNDLVIKSEQAMKQSKKMGKDIYSIYDENIKSLLTLKSTMIKSFNQALNNEEFEMFFQPRHDVKTGQIVSSEALLRWNKKGQFVTPDVFLEAAEESGMIVNICNSAFNLAFSQYQSLFSGSPPIMLSINVSAKQLAHTDFLNDLFSMMELHQFPSKKLEVELTEQSLIQNFDSSLSTLKALSSAGVKIALDDFGTGYSSLSYLKYFPIDILKIDKSFIKDIHKNNNDLELTKAIIAMGKSLGMEVVAEGVEIEKHLKILAEIYCHQAQGYYLNKPLKFSEFSQLFIHYREIKSALLN